MYWIDTIRNYKPFNEQEGKDKETILKAYDGTCSLLTRENTLAHFSSSGFIVNPSRDKVLMVHHNIYDTWTWTGGHVDGEEDFLKVALKEAKEETGIVRVKPITCEIIAIDILPVFGHIKRGTYVSAHLHLNVTYLLEASESESLRIKADENSDVKWLPIKSIEEYCNEPYVVKVYKKIIKRMHALDEQG